MASASASSASAVVTLLCWGVFLLLFLCCSHNGSYAYAYINNNGGQRRHDALQIQTTSLLRGPPWHCSPSNPQGNQYYEGASKMKVVHRHGPCSKLSTTTQNTTNIHTAATRRLTQHILSLDQSRVDSIQSKRRPHSNPNSDAADLPAKSGLSIGSANYIITVGLGTPKRDLSLSFDTGSDLTWTQCKPCIKRCYAQKEPIFDPSLSKTYKNVSCGSPQCSLLTSATGNSVNCSSTCVYGIRYGDESFSFGYFAEDTLRLTPTDVFPNFLFGCGQDNEGLFKGFAGLLGLGRHQLSLVSQTASKYGKYFSYCLPSTSSSTGHLTLGKGSTPENLKFTPFSFARNLRQMDSFYFVDFTKIRVGGVTLSISQTVFKRSMTIIDSGTVITRLPPVAYAALRTTFRKQMKKYPLTDPFSILDTCYDLSRYKTVLIPKISIFFRGYVEVPIDVSGIIFAVDASQACLAFAGNSDASDVGIIGNAQQQTLEVVYDVAGEKLGFATGGCS